MPVRHRGKVFGIGLSRTGTTSLNSALRLLGYKTLHYPGDEGTLNTLLAGRADFPCLQSYDGITDITAYNYRELDRLYPNSKFILTVRDEASWLDSCQQHWERAGTDLSTIKQVLRMSVYGCLDFQPERFAEVYRKHVADAQAYFADRPQQLLVLNITAGQGFEQLAPFLGVSMNKIRSCSFPHRGARKH